MTADNYDKIVKKLAAAAKDTAAETMREASDELVKIKFDIQNFMATETVRV